MSGKGKAHRPYEFGVKVSVATTLGHSKGGQFIVHAKALQGNPMGATRSPPSFPRSKVLSASISSTSSPIAAIAATTRRRRIASRFTSRVRSGASPSRSNARCGEDQPSSRSSATPNPTTEWTAITLPGRPAMRSTPCAPRAGHTKSDHRMDRNCLAGKAGDAINTVLAAAGYNFRRLLAWFSLLLSAIWIALTARSCYEPVHERA